MAPDGLTKRIKLFPDNEDGSERPCTQDPKLRGFHKPQREHVKQEMPPRNKHDKTA